MKLVPRKWEWCNNAWIKMSKSLKCKWPNRVAMTAEYSPGSKQSLLWHSSIYFQTAKYLSFKIFFAQRYSKVFLFSTLKFLGKNLNLEIIQLRCKFWQTLLKNIANTTKVGSFAFIQNTKFPGNQCQQDWLMTLNVQLIVRGHLARVRLRAGIPETSISGSHDWRIR